MSGERRRVYYSGRVQGVGFRITSRRLARGVGVAGYVRNLADGRVELVAEGEGPQLSSFLDAVRREFGAQIHDAQVSDEPTADPPLSGFEIRY